MILDENLFEEVKKGDVRGPYKKKELSDQEIFDKVFDKLQAKLISKHYKVGTDGNNLFVNARVVNKKLPNGRVVIKKEFLTDKKDYEDIIKYLDEANVKHEFKDSVQGLQLNILLDKDNAKDVNQEVLNRNARVKNEDLPANRFKLKKYNDNTAVIGRSGEELKELKQYYLSQVKKYNDMKAYDEAKWYQKQADWCDRELSRKEESFKVYRHIDNDENNKELISTEKTKEKAEEKVKEINIETGDDASIVEENLSKLNERFRLIRTIEDAQQEVDDDLEKFGKIGGGLYDDLDAAGFYVDENNKVQYKVKPVKEDLNTFDYDKLQKELEAIPNVTKVDFDKDLIYDTKELVILVNWHSDSDTAQWFRDKVAVKTKAIEVFKNNGLKLSDPVEDNGDYYYFVLREITPKAESLKEDWRFIDKIDNVKIKVNLSDNGFYLFDETSEDENDYIDGGYKTYREAESAAKKLKKELKEEHSKEKEIKLDRKSALEVFEDLEDDADWYNNHYNAEFKLNDNELIIKAEEYKLKEIIKDYHLEDYDVKIEESLKEAELRDNVPDYVEEEIKKIKDLKDGEKLEVKISGIEKYCVEKHSDNNYTTWLELSSEGVSNKFDNRTLYDVIYGLINVWGLKFPGKETMNDLLKEELSPEQEKEYGLTTMINSLIKDELEAIDEYNSAIVTLEAENKGEFTDVIRDIISEENTHIGQLQAILKELNPSTTADIDEGQKEGQEQIDQAVGVTKGDTEETTTTIDTEEGVIKTYKLDNVEKIEEK